MAFEGREFFRVLFLDKKNGLIADEVQGSGTVDHAPVYPREVMRRALELSATAIVLVHNHPSGDPTPSTQDVKMTLDIITVAKSLGVTVHDHITGEDGERELVMARWGMRGPLQYGGHAVTNIRNVSSPHRRGWPGARNRCVAPTTSF